MMRVSDALRGAWAKAEADVPGPPGEYRRRIESVGPLAVYAGVGIPDRLRRVTVRIPLAAFGSREFAHTTRGYSVAQEKPSLDYPGDALVHFVEAPSPLPKELFLIFCSDVLENARLGQSESEAVSRVHARLQHWTRFFASRPETGLTREEYIGLYSELEFLQRCLLAGMASGMAIASWSGPFGANQDFLFGPIAVEVKAATGNDPELVRVSNVRQLDDTGLEGLYLAHSAYDFRTSCGRSLAQLVQEIRLLLEGDPMALEGFEERLSFAGYSEAADGVFRGYGFVLRSQSDYRVDDDFPRILEAVLPEGVLDVSYTIHLSSAAKHRLAHEDLLTNLREGASDACP